MHEKEKKEMSAVQLPPDPTHPADLWSPSPKKEAVATPFKKVSPFKAPFEIESIEEPSD